MLFSLTDFEPGSELKSLSLVQREVDRDGRDNLHRVAVQVCGPVNPLPHGIQRGADQQRVALDELQFADAAVRADDADQFHRARNARLARQRRIDRYDLVDEFPVLHHAARP